MVIGLRRAAESTSTPASTATALCGPQPRVLEFAVTGMTCAACAARIQRKLDRLDGVSARVSYAAERATVTVAAEVRPDAIVAQIEKTGYGARLLPPPGADAGQTATEAETAARIRDLRRRLWVAVLFSIPLCNVSLG